MNLECQMSATTTTRTIAGGHSNSNKGNDNDNDSASVMNARAKVAVRQAIGQLDESECTNTRIHTYLHMYVHTREQLYLRLLVQVGRCCKVGGQHFFIFLFFVFFLAYFVVIYISWRDTLCWCCKLRKTGNKCTFACKKQHKRS